MADHFQGQGQTMQRLEGSDPREMGGGGVRDLIQLAWLDRTFSLITKILATDNSEMPNDVIKVGPCP